MFTKKNFPRMLKIYQDLVRLKTQNLNAYVNDWHSNYNYRMQTESGLTYIAFSFTYYHAKLSEHLIKKNTETIIEKLANEEL